MNKKHTSLKFYLLSAIAPPAATLFIFVIEGYLQRGNIHLIYLFVILAVAVRTSTGPGLLSALLSFLMYNFFFTEPRYSLVMIYREDMLTVGFFLLVAALTGHQSARLRQQLHALQDRTMFARVQLDLLEHLAGAVDRQQVFKGLHAASTKLSSVSCFVIDPAGDQLDVVVGTAVLKDKDRECINRLLSGEGGRGAELTGSYRYYSLNDGVDTIAVAGFSRHSAAVSAPLFQEIIETLVYQTSLALGRTRLARDLEKEKMEKERELLRSALLTSVSHDLRTPLSSMIGSASSLVELGGSLSEGQKTELLEAILQEASRLDGYIQNLLDMTRLGYSGLRLERDWIGLDELLSVVMRRIKPLLKGHNIKTSIPADTPLLYVHAALVEQAIYNVVENAVKHSPVGSTIKVSAETNDRCTLIEVRDNGPGIPASERERVFDMFYTANRRDRHSAGTGLGLAICKGMIGAHGGGVEILDNDDGGGCLVRMSIPLTKNEVPGRIT